MMTPNGSRLPRGRLRWAAALWGRRERYRADPLNSCIVIAQAAHGAAGNVHGRMLATMRTPQLAHIGVSSRVNGSRGEGADLLEPAAMLGVSIQAAIFWGQLWGQLSICVRAF